MLGVIPHVCSGLFEEGQGHSFRTIGIAPWGPRPASTAIVPCGFSVARVPSLALPQPRWLEALARSNTPCRVRTLGRRCSYGGPDVLLLPRWPEDIVRPPANVPCPDSRRSVSFGGHVVLLQSRWLEARRPVPRRPPLCRVRTLGGVFPHAFLRFRPPHFCGLRTPHGRSPLCRARPRRWQSSANFHMYCSNLMWFETFNRPPPTVPYPDAR